MSSRFPSVEELVWGKKSKKRTKRRKFPKSVKDAVWGKYIGMNKAEGKCYVCKRTIHIRDFDVGHNKAVAKGGSDNITNLRPICRSCNLSMGTMSIEAYKQKYFSKTKKKKTTKKKRPKPRRPKTPLERYAEKMEKFALG